MSGLSAKYLTSHEYGYRFGIILNTYVAALLSTMVNIIWLVSRTIKSFKKDQNNILPTTSTKEKETKKSTRNRLWQ